MDTKFSGSANYVASRDLMETVNIAVALQKPLLIKGEPGTGKTMLAQAVADALGKKLIIWNVKSTTKAQDGLYVYDTVQRLYDSQFGGEGAVAEKGGRHAGGVVAHGPSTRRLRLGAETRLCPCPCPARFRVVSHVNPLIDRSLPMSTLIVLGYPSEEEAKSAYQKVLDLDKNLIVSLQSIAVVARHADGKYDVVTPGSKVGTSTVWGLFWGVLFGLLFFVPVFGAAIGAGIGALTGAIVKHGVDKDFQDRVRNLLSTDDSAAVFMVVDEMTTDKFIDAIRPFGGDVLQTSLSVKDEDELKHALFKN